MMSYFNFLELNDDVRDFMLEEMNLDVSKDILYPSKRLNQLGLEVYPALLTKAIESGDDESFHLDLENGEYFNSFELTKKGQKRVPINAPKLLAQSEFNRFYIRGVCLKAIKNSVTDVEVYRARESRSLRPESARKIGMKINAQNLLDDLRNTIGTSPTILPEINSGLSVKL